MSLPTKQVDKVLKWAKNYAVFYRHEYITTAHLLLSLASSRETLAREIIDSIARSDTIVDFIRECLKPGKYVSRHDIYADTSLMRVKDRSVEIAQSENSHLLTTDHLLLALLENENNEVVIAMKRFGITYNTVQSMRKEISSELTEGFESSKQEQEQLEYKEIESSPKFEYLFISDNRTAAMEKLKSKGEQGWEAINCQIAGGFMYVLLKRRIK